MSTRARFDELKQFLSGQILGQPDLVEALIISLLTDGHLLIEGTPGLAKTRAVKALAQGIQAEFQRVQFTPDLIPSDVTGSEIYRPDQQIFEFQPGPVFANLVLADEINRAPAKVQAALLEAMSERQVSVGRTTRPLPELFMVIATQNPLEQEGTYPLPEAQLDRFLLQVKLGFPDVETERRILRLTRGGDAIEPPSDWHPLTTQDVLAARAEVNQVHVAPAIEDYLVHLADATRRPTLYDDELANYIQSGISPRATIALEHVSRALAWIKGQNYVTPDLVQRALPWVYQHRISVHYRALANGVTPDQVVARLIQSVAVS
ncbi:MAG: AAA family ATPase [Natronospirillum sp.]